MDTTRVSVGTLSLSRDLRRALAKARALGLHGVEIDARTGVDIEQMSQTGVRQIRKWLADEGLEVAAVAFPTRGGYADPERLEPRIAATKSALQFAHGLGAPIVLNHVGAIPHPAVEPAAAGVGGEAAAPAPDPRWQLLVEVLADLGDWGQRVGATLCAEAGRAAPADLVRLFASLPEGALACHLVTGSLVVHGHDPVAAVDMLGAQVAHVHATDAIAGSFAGRGRAVILGSGQVDLPNVLAALEERGYRGWIGIEPVDRFGAEAEVADALAALAAL